MALKLLKREAPAGSADLSSVAIAETTPPEDAGFREAGVHGASGRTGLLGLRIHYDPQRQVLQMRQLRPHEWVPIMPIGKRIRMPVL
jgi:hypothetical protein